MVGADDARRSAVVPCRRDTGSTDGTPEADVTVSVVAGPDRNVTEVTLNTFLNCCLDASMIDRFVVFDTGLSTQDRAALLDRYPFLEFSPSVPPADPGALLTHIRAEIAERFWLHLGHGWQFFDPNTSSP